MRLVAALFGLLAVIAPQVAAQISSAHAVLHAFYNSTNANTDQPLLGTVDFSQHNSGSGMVNITVRVSGLQAGKTYSLHVHQYGNLVGFLSDPSTSSAVLTNNQTLFNVGPRFQSQHGCGLGNISIPDQTLATAWTTVTLQSDWLDLGLNSTSTTDSIIGRAVVLREMPDTCPTDHTQLGGYLAVGVIGVNDIASQAKADTQTVDSTNSAPKAVALIYNITSKKPVGYIHFWSDSMSRTHMSGVVHGFKPRSVHGIHVHAAGNEDTNITIGGHWTGAGTVHELPPTPNRHWGDLGNVIADSNGVITFKDVWAPLNLISLWNSTNSIVGRSISIHEGPDDGGMFTYGNRYIFGVIGLTDATFPLPGVPDSVYPTVARAHVVLRAFYNNTDQTAAGTWPDAPLVGNITFTQNVGGTGDVNVTVVVAGLKGNHAYGLHVHGWGNLVNSFDRSTGAPRTTWPALSNATDPVQGGIGPHFNPWNAPSHGCGYGNPDRHAGDVGNITVGNITDADRFTFFTYTLKSELLDLGRDSLAGNSIIGRAISIHDRPNPCDGSPLGNWIAVGVIGIDQTSTATDKTQNVAQPDTFNVTAANNSPKANAVIRDFRGNNGLGQIVGDVFFWSGPSGEIYMGGAVAGFAAGSSHGVHIHQFGNENTNLTIGQHFSAPGLDGGDFHQIPPYPGRHLGDVIAKVTADSNGVITFANVSAGFELVSLTNPANSLIGHSIAFHEFEDTGNPVSYGPRFKYGVIGLVHPDFPIPTNFSAFIILPPATISTPAPTTTPSPTTGPGSTGPTPSGNATTAPPTTTAPTNPPNGTTTIPPTNRPPSAATTTAVDHMWLAIVVALAAVAAAL